MGYQSRPSYPDLNSDRASLLTAAFGPYLGPLSLPDPASDQAAGSSLTHSSADGAAVGPSSGASSGQRPRTASSRPIASAPSAGRARLYRSRVVATSLWPSDAIVPKTANDSRPRLSRARPSRRLPEVSRRLAISRAGAYRLVRSGELWRTRWIDRLLPRPSGTTATLRSPARPELQPQSRRLGHARALKRQPSHTRRRV